MKKQELRGNLLLLLAAAIWGFAFIAQRIGAKFLGAFAFNGIRFAIGGLSLLPLVLYFRVKRSEEEDQNNGSKNVNILASGAIAGLVLFLASSFQQIGMSVTTAGKAAFITGLYIVLVPVFGVFLKQRTHLNTWIAVVFAIIGLYLLSVNENFSISKGDILELSGSVFWAIHILLIDNFSKKMDALKLSMVQFFTCSVLSLIVAFIFEDITLKAISEALIPLLYGGICSVGIAYTLQAIGQKHAKPSHAAIILSMESVFAGLGGFILLGENLGSKGYLGCALMLTGMLVSQLKNFSSK